MSNPKQRKGEVKRRPGRKELVAAKRAKADVLTVEDVAARLGIGRNAAYGLVQSGYIPSLRFGRRYLIPRAVFARLVSGESLTAATAS
jgi:excisionase family DNA binding protein